MAAPGEILLPKLTGLKTIAALSVLLAHLLGQP